MSKVILTAVAGVTFRPNYPDNLLQISTAAMLLPGEEKLTAVLIRNPDNEYDGNDIEVHIPAVEGGLVGHIPRSVAMRIAPLMDDGWRASAIVESVRVHTENPTNPGVDIRVFLEDVEDERTW